MKATKTAAPKKAKQQATQGDKLRSGALKSSKVAKRSLKSTSGAVKKGFDAFRGSVKSFIVRNKKLSDLNDVWFAMTVYTVGLQAVRLLRYENYSDAILVDLAPLGIFGLVWVVATLTDLGSSPEAKGKADAEDK